MLLIWWHRYEFFQEFGLMKQPLVKEVEMTETLKSLFGAVNRATGDDHSQKHPTYIVDSSYFRSNRRRCIPGDAAG